MNGSERVDPKVMQRLVLARLLVRTKRKQTHADVTRAVAAAIRPPLSAAESKEAAQDAFTAAERAGWIRSARAAGRSRVARPVLTTEGKRAALAVLGKPPSSWEHAQQRIALHAIDRSNLAAKKLSVDALAAVILAERQNTPPTLETLPAVIDYLAWRALGVETTKPFSIEAVQRHLLRELVPADVRVDAKVWRRMLAMRAANANGHDAPALTRALFALPARRAPEPSLGDFAAAVHEAARMPTVVRFHDDRAFIGSIWDHMRGRQPVDDMTLPEFKRRLIAAHRDGLLRITRADLVGAMDRREVERSEARFQDATFHFVALEAGGVG